MRVSLTRTDCLALAVAHAAVAYHLGSEFQFAQEINMHFGENSRIVEIRTPEFHQNPSQKFVVVVDFVHDEDYECKAELRLNGNLLRRFWWDFAGPKLNLLELENTP